MIVDITTHSAELYRANETMYNLYTVEEIKMEEPVEVKPYNQEVREFVERNEAEKFQSISTAMDNDFEMAMECMRYVAVGKIKSGSYDISSVRDCKNILNRMIEEYYEAQTINDVLDRLYTQKIDPKSEPVR